MASRDNQTKSDIDYIISGCTGLGNPLDELTLLRVAFRKYADGMAAADAVAWACQQMSDTLAKIPSR